MSDFYPIDNPPLLLLTPHTPPVTQREKSAVRQLLASVMEGSLATEAIDPVTGERMGISKLEARLEEVYQKDGARVWVNTVKGLLEYTIPKLQRITVEDPHGNTPQLPVINITFPRPLEFEQSVPIDITPNEEPDGD